MTVVHAPQGRLDPVLRRELGTVTALAWPGADEQHDPALDPELFVTVEDGEVVAGLAVLSKPIEHAGRVWRASGLSAVVTHPDHRGRGHAAALAATARAWILSEHGADLGIFTADRGTAHVYERGGWTVAPGAVLVGGTAADPFPSDSPGMDKVVLLAADDLPAALAAVAGSRVLLHPGEVDRLW